MTLMVTGHRKLVPAGWTGNPYPDNNPEITLWHDQIFHAMFSHVRTYALSWQAEHNVAAQFISGMAIGADQLFAIAVLQLRDEGIEYALHAACPFFGQESKWPSHSQEAFQDILNRCTTVTNVSGPGYAPWKMQVRNQWMVDRSHHVLAVWDGQAGGTNNCVQYAIEQGRVIDQLNPHSLEIYRINE